MHLIQNKHTHFVSNYLITRKYNSMLCCCVKYCTPVFYAHIIILIRFLSFFRYRYASIFHRSLTICSSLAILRGGCNVNPTKCASRFPGSSQTFLRRVLHSSMAADSAHTSTGAAALAVLSLAALLAQGEFKYC